MKPEPKHTPGLASPYGVVSEDGGKTWAVELNIPNVTRQAVYIGLPERPARDFAQCLNSAYVIGAVNEPVNADLLEAAKAYIEEAYRLGQNRNDQEHGARLLHALHAAIVKAEGKWEQSPA